MDNASIKCPSCQVAWQVEPRELAALRRCPRCRRDLELQLFPALWRKAAPVERAERVLEDGEASCFYHAEKQAAHVCDQCGRFICKLCNLDVKGKHLCPACLEKGSVEVTGVSFDRKRILYDTMAVQLAVAPLVLAWPLTLLTAPAALCVALIYRKRPLSLTRRSRWRFWAAGVLAALQIAGWITAAIVLYYELSVQNG